MRNYKKKYLSGQFNKIRYNPNHDQLLSTSKFTSDGLFTIYHGTSINNGKSILNFGYFNANKKKDMGWGNTYGEGIYFTPNINEARNVYAKNGILLSVCLYIRPYQLRDDYSVSKKNHQTKLKKLISKLKKNTNRNCLINIRCDEIIFFGDEIKNKNKIKIKQIV